MFRRNWKSEIQGTKYYIPQTLLEIIKYIEWKNILKEVRKNLIEIKNCLWGKGVRLWVKCHMSAKSIEKIYKILYLQWNQSFLEFLLATFRPSTGLYQVNTCMKEIKCVCIHQSDQWHYNPLITLILWDPAPISMSLWDPRSYCGIQEKHHVYIYWLVFISPCDMSPQRRCHVNAQFLFCSVINQWDRSDLLSILMRETLFHLSNCQPVNLPTQNSFYFFGGGYRVTVCWWHVCHHGFPL